MTQNALTGYENEPREYFEPLPALLHSLFYHHERLSGNIQPELHFYLNAFKEAGCRLIELGCGTSLIADHLADYGFQVTGIDLDHTMLSFRNRQVSNTLVQMDMCDLGFQPCFGGALIAHNTLNLLVDETRIRHCLTGLKHVMIPPGILVAHLHIANKNIAYTDSEGIEQKLLQFHIFDLPTGEKIVKESITSQFPEQNVLQIEQRYKYRNFLQPGHNRNYQQVLQLASFTAEKWLTIFTESGFTPVATSSKFSDLQPDSESTLVLTASAYQ